MRDKWLPCTERIFYRRPYAIKNFSPSRLWMPELVVYGIRELASNSSGLILNLE